MSGVYKSILTICIGFGIIFLITGNPLFYRISIAIGFISLISQRAAKYIEWGWMKIGEILGMFIPKILLTLIFYLFLTPIALVYRSLVSKDMLHLKNDGDSFFIKVDKTFDQDSFKKPW